MKPLYLFSIDLEDVRLLIEGGERYREAVPKMTRLLLSFLREQRPEVGGAKITFFVVGEMARRYPDLIAEILADGHEIGCHTDQHTPLDRLGRGGFDRDLERNIEALRRAGASDITGFRAPIFSLTEKTSWAYTILAEHGIRYSSSVLPARSPLYGWQEFGVEPKVVDSVLELPMSIGRVGPLTVPFGGGIYFRVLPRILLQWLFSSFQEKPVLGYLHPYDIDSEQERFMHAGINDSAFYNWLMYYGRSRALQKLSWFLTRYETVRYDRYISTLRPT